jgi:regulator of PEP synthase PpsR (kinase-PPPase family)
MAKYHIFAISGSTGRTAEMAVKAALAQFTDREVEISIYPNISSTLAIDKLLKKAQSCNGLVIHTFVKHELADYIWEKGRMYNLEVINLLGPIINRLSGFLSASPLEEEGLFRKLNKDYFKRIETTEFALKHDDGANTDGLRNAEMVLLGVSRTFKTPLSVYLAFKGWMVANVPIVLNVPLPDIIYELPPERIFCLTTNANALSGLRKARNEYLHGMADQYSSFDYVSKELNYANTLFALHSEWSIIRVTAKPIEEIATNIINIYRRKTGN